MRVEDSLLSCSPARFPIYFPQISNLSHWKRLCVRVYVCARTWIKHRCVLITIGRHRLRLVQKTEIVPVMMPFLSSGSAQLTLSDVSRISVKLRCRTGPGAKKKRLKEKAEIIFFIFWIKYDTAVKCREPNWMCLLSVLVNAPIQHTVPTHTHYTTTRITTSFILTLSKLIHQNIMISKK